MSLGPIKLLHNWRAYYALKSNQPGRHIPRLRNGLLYTLRSNTMDKSILKDVWVKEVYARHGITVEPTDIVVDLGGHAGIFTAYAGYKAREGRVIAFEPFPENFELLSRNVAVNNMTHVTAINCAVSGTNGKSQLNIADDKNTGGHSLHFDDKHEGQLTVDTLTLADMMKKYKLSKIDYLKLDCEGAEFDILLNAKNVLTDVHKVVMECHVYDKEKPASLLTNVLEEHGFHVIEEPTGHSHITMVYAKRL